jgi:hypothetical protein
VPASWKASYAKLLNFIETTDRYQTDRLFGHLPNEGTRICCTISVSDVQYYQTSLRRGPFFSVDSVVMSMPLSFMFTVCKITSKQRSSWYRIADLTRYQFQFIGIASASIVRSLTPRGFSCPFYEYIFNLQSGHQRTSFNRLWTLSADIAPASIQSKA